MKVLKLVGMGYLVLGLMALIALFVRDCIANDKFLLHFIGIFLTIPALSYGIWRFYDDIREYVEAGDLNIRRQIDVILSKRIRK